MIQNILPVLAGQLNDYFRSTIGASRDVVVVGPPSGGDGNENDKDRVNLFLLHIEEEKAVRNGQHQANAGSNPPISVSVIVMMSASFPVSGYLKALEAISLIIEFFQGKHVFDHQNTPLLTDNVDRITADFVTWDLKELNQLWVNLGVQMLPSVTYRIRLLTYNGFIIRDEVPSVVRHQKGGGGELGKLMGASLAGVAGGLLAGSAKRDDDENAGEDEA